jgi:radical SAM protein with 4Fe4S-binding SPASM domain
MRIKDCVLKMHAGDAWLHHTASSYKVRLNAASVAALRSMAQRRSEAEMTPDERYIHDRLAAKGIAGPDTGLAADRLVPLKDKSPLDLVELEFSGRCNLRCAHCFSELTQRDMDRPVMDRVFAGIDALEPVTLVVSGGEPLLNPLLPEALRLARSRRLRTCVMTNAVLAGREIAALFKETGVAKAAVSLDFFEADHDAIRGPGAFRKAVAGIGNLVSAGVPVFVTAMVTENTADRTEEFRRFCLEELGASGLRFSAVNPVGRARGAGLGLSGPRLKELFSKGRVGGGEDGEETFARLAGGRHFHCGAGASQCFVSADGKVYACHYFQNIGEAMGDLAERTLEEIYRAYTSSGAVAADFDWKRLAGCAACPHFARCKGGCRARARLTEGGWYAPDQGSCALYRGIGIL